MATIERELADVNSAAKPFDDHPFIWLNKWIMFSPMWTSSTVKNNKIVARNKCCAKFGYYSVTTINIIFFIWDVYYMVYRAGGSLFSLMAIFSIFMTTASKAICIWYFYHHFQYYGLPHLHEANMNNSDNKSDNKTAIDIELPSRLKSAVSSLTYDKHNKLVRRTNIRFKVILVWIISASIFIRIILTINAIKYLPDDNPTEKYMIIWHQIFGFIYIYYYQIPLFLAQFVLSIYYVRACIFVKEFTENMDSNIGIDFDAAIHEYSAYRNMFVDAIMWIERLMLLRLASQIGWIWVDLTGIMEAPKWYEAFDDLLWLSISCWPFLEMVMAGNAATNKFHALHEKLYRFGTEKSYFSELSIERGIDHSRYLFLLDYVSEYPFIIQILAQEISFKNAARVSVAFIAAKTISYLFKSGIVEY